MLAQEGTYYGACKVISPDTARTGTPLLRATFEITHIVADGQWSPVAVFDRDLRIYLSDAAWPSSVKKLELLQFNSDFDNPAITSEGVSLTCKHETFEHKKREKWELTDFSGGSECNPPDKNTLLKLNARYKTATAASKTPAGSPPPPPVSSAGDDLLAKYEGTPPSDSEVPEENDVPF